MSFENTKTAQFMKIRDLEVENTLLRRRLDESLEHGRSLKIRLDESQERVSSLNRTINYWVSFYYLVCDYFPLLDRMYDDDISKVRISKLSNLFDKVIYKKEPYSKLSDVLKQELKEKVYNCLNQALRQHMSILNTIPSIVYDIILKAQIEDGSFKHKGMFVQIAKDFEIFL